MNSQKGTIPQNRSSLISRSIRFRITLPRFSRTTRPEGTRSQRVLFSTSLRCSRFFFPGFFMNFSFSDFLYLLLLKLIGFCSSIRLYKKLSSFDAQFSWSDFLGCAVFCAQYKTDQRLCLFLIFFASFFLKPRRALESLALSFSPANASASATSAVLWPLQVRGHFLHWSGSVLLL